mmetsp:Transcript_33690/g.106480  ORF Transcript_33690/g.106480 Transcript_33690/m.106480 type:complete len:264 (-) Transcript_33690:464-1255(-)
MRAHEGARVDDAVAPDARVVPDEAADLAAPEVVGGFAHANYHAFATEQPQVGDHGLATQRGIVPDDTVPYVARVRQRRAVHEHGVLHLAAHAHLLPDDDRPAEVGAAEDARPRADDGRPLNDDARLDARAPPDEDAPGARVERGADDAAAAADVQAAAGGAHGRRRRLLGTRVDGLFALRVGVRHLAVRHGLLRSQVDGLHLEIRLRLPPADDAVRRKDRVARLGVYEDVERAVEHEFAVLRPLVIGQKCGILKASVSEAIPP